MIPEILKILGVINSKVDDRRKDQCLEDRQWKSLRSKREKKRRI